MDPTYTAQDLLKVDTVIGYLAQNRAIEFQLKGSTMERKDAKTHFDDRAALLRVRKIVIDEAERISK